MLTYEIIVKYETKNLFPQISWKQNTEPTELEIMETLQDFMEKHKIPKDYIENKSVVFVDAFENGLFSDPEVYQIDFSIIK